MLAAKFSSRGEICGIRPFPAPAEEETPAGAKRAPSRGVGPREGVDNLRSDAPRGARPVRRGPGNMVSGSFGGRRLADAWDVELRSQDSHASHGPWGPAQIPATGTRLADPIILVSRAQPPVREHPRTPEPPSHLFQRKPEQSTCHGARNRSRHRRSGPSPRRSSALPFPAPGSPRRGSARRPDCRRVSPPKQ